MSRPAERLRPALQNLAAIHCNHIALGYHAPCAHCLFWAGETVKMLRCQMPEEFWCLPAEEMEKAVVVAVSDG